MPLLTLGEGGISLPAIGSHLFHLRNALGEWRLLPRRCRAFRRAAPKPNSVSC